MSTENPAITRTEDPNVKKVRKHLENKGTYRRSYIALVCNNLEKHPDLAEEFARCLPKNYIADHYIEVRGESLKTLGISTMLSRSAIYVVLCRLRDEKLSVKKIVQEETVNLKHGRIAG